MTANTDPQRRPVLYDVKNQRLLADPVIGSTYYVIPSPLTADQTIDLINTATSSVIQAARVTAGSTSGAGVLQLTDSVSSTSVTTAATPNAVKSAYDLAAAALPASGGTMSGTITFAAGQTISGYVATSEIGVSVQAYDADTAKTDVVQSYSAAQRGTVVTLSAAPSVSPDFAAGNHFALLLDQNVTLANPVNVVAGQSGAITVTQDATGRSLSYGSVWKFEGGAPSIDATPNSVSLLAYYVESASRITAVLVQNSVS